MGEPTLLLPSMDVDEPFDTSGIDFEVPGDGPRDELPVEEDAEAEEPAPGVLCVPKIKAKRYENSVSSTTCCSIDYSQSF